ncbi:homoserine dehydrogenase-domain-containing protein [Obelidium mucronatum]|nr:homoserine dehydrogenase-domain-containing protein [Obelidium mucronatum]
MTISVVLIGPGLVGSAFLAQLHAHQRRNVAPFVRVVAVATSSQTAADASPRGLELAAAAWRAHLAPSSDALAAAEAAARAAAAQGGAAVVVDCTAADAVAQRYPAWLRAGLHVVTPNKKAFSGPLPLWADIKDAANSSSSLVFHESTVGAGLPILSTLSDLVATGDEIVKIEGIFSGTLSYIFNNYSTTSESATPQRFSDIVNVAKAKGYTEPDPRDDLNGMDVGRKVVILGRVAGIPLSLDTLPIENIVPEPLRGITSVDEFMKKLPDFDAHFTALNDAAKAKGRVLRCVGVVDPVNGSSVRLAEYDASHPFASLKGSDNIIAFTTRRFPNPLIVQGAGAGDDVTAFGIFSDLLKIAARVEYSSR